MKAMDEEDWVSQGFDQGFEEGWKAGLWHAYCEMWQVAMIHNLKIIDSVVGHMKRTSYPHLEHEVAALETEALGLREYAKTTLPYLP